MEENTNEQQTNENANFNISEENVKEEAQETIEEVKNTIKNTNLKNDTKAAKGFFTSFFRKPLEELKKVATDTKSSFFRIALIILVVWVIATFLYQMLSIANNYLFSSIGSFSYFFRHLFSNILNIIKSVIAPLLSVVILSGLVYGFKKNKNKSFVTIVSTIIVAKIPVIIANILNLLLIFGSGISKVLSYFSDFCSILSTILIYFAFKHLSDESQDENYFWKFALIIGIYCVIRFVLSYLGIYLV